LNIYIYIYIFSFRGSDAAGLSSFPHSAPEGLDPPPSLNVFPRSPELARLLSSQEPRRPDEPMLQVNLYSLKIRAGRDKNTRPINGTKNCDQRVEAIHLIRSGRTRRENTRSKKELRPASGGNPSNKHHSGCFGTGFGEPTPDERGPDVFPSSTKHRVHKSFNELQGRARAIHLDPRDAQTRGVQKRSLNGTPQNQSETWSVKISQRRGCEDQRPKDP
jgi:hypothetical protein